MNPREVPRYLPRRLLPFLKERLHEMPAVVLLDPRQVGKTTLALEVCEELGGI